MENHLDFRDNGSEVVFQNDRETSPEMAPKSKSDRKGGAKSSERKI